MPILCSFTIKFFLLRIYLLIIDKMRVTYTSRFYLKCFENVVFVLDFGQYHQLVAYLKSGVTSWDYQLGFIADNRNNVERQRYFHFHKRNVLKREAVVKHYLENACISCAERKKLLYLAAVYLTLKLTCNCLLYTSDAADD